MDAQTIIAVLLSVIGFFLVNLYIEMKKIGRNVEKLMINEAANQERLQDLERRVTNVENTKIFSHGKR